MVWVMSDKSFHQFDMDISPQPDDLTCGPTCLHSVYRYYKDDIPLENVIKEVHTFEGGGTLAVWMACHALKEGIQRRFILIIYRCLIPPGFLMRKRR